jgi:hypothetical protein
VKEFGVLCIVTLPNCSSIPTSAQIDTKISFEGAYARRIFDAHVASMYVELPVLGVPDLQVHLSSSFPPPIPEAATPLDFSSIFIYPFFEREASARRTNRAFCQCGWRVCAF